MTLLVELSRRAHVYRFGARWHWKCGADKTTPGDCLGGPAHTQEAAYRAAFDHITEDHCTLYETPVAPDGCRYCGVEAGGHGVQHDVTMGLHEYRPPSRRQRDARLAQRRQVVPS